MADGDAFWMILRKKRNVCSEIMHIFSVFLYYAFDLDEDGKTDFDPRTPGQEKGTVEGAGAGAGGCL